jgi:inhibitor of cysteine peptidase
MSEEIRMRARHALVVTAALALTTAASLELGSPAGARPFAGAAAVGTVTVGPAANGTTVRLHVSDRLVVRLPGNPTTGYRWSALRVPAPLHVLSSVYVPSQPKRLGQGGTYVFRFAAGRGSGTLKLVYRRPWETKTPPLRTFTLTVRSG